MTINKNLGMDKYIEAFNKKDESAFRHIHDHFFNGLYFFAKKLTHDKEEAKDIASKAMAKLWMARGTFDTYTNIKAFLYITTRNECLNFINKRLNTTKGKNEYYKIQVPSDVDVERFFYDTEIVQALLAVINELPKQQSQVLRLWFIDDIPPADIANRLEITVNTVYVLKRNGILSLRKLLAEKKLEHLLYLLIFLKSVHLLN
jgi:RNA polymerase sigma factor (sigma-70 family)